MELESWSWRRAWFSSWSHFCPVLLVFRCRWRWGISFKLKRSFRSSPVGFNDLDCPLYWFIKSDNQNHYSSLKLHRRQSVAWSTVSLLWLTHLAWCYPSSTKLWWVFLLSFGYMCKFSHLHRNRPLGIWILAYDINRLHRDVRCCVVSFFFFD